MATERYLSGGIREDLSSGKMVFLGGPRQVGKTTCALAILGGDSKGKHPGYLSWDVAEHRRQLRAAELPPNEPLVVLDEIHKYARWRGLVKGLYDTTRGDRSFIVTGSARLDYYRKGGDSLQGRYHYFRLHPLSLGELQGRRPEVAQLLEFGGFPEPFFELHPGFFDVGKESASNASCTVTSAILKGSTKSRSLNSFSTHCRPASVRLSRSTPCRLTSRLHHEP